MKAGDLLATPASFWISAVQEAPTLAGYFGDFQLCVSASRFPLIDCPYPVTVAMYAEIRWYMDHDHRYSGQWTQDEFDALFRAFFWRNALSTRYDQGFLSQSATDMRLLKDILFRRAGVANANDWATGANEFLDRSAGMPLPSAAEVEKLLLQAKPAGALGRALSLPVRTRPSQDLLDPSVSIVYPSTKPVELHHIYPASWCANNRHGALEDVLDPNKAEYDYAKSVANLTPLTRESNNVWRAKTPGQALTEKGIQYQSAQFRLASHYISEDAFGRLTAASPDPQGFWEARARDDRGRSCRAMQRPSLIGPGPMPDQRLGLLLERCLYGGSRKLDRGACAHAQSRPRGHTQCSRHGCGFRRTHGPRTGSGCQTGRVRDSTGSPAQIQQFRSCERGQADGRRRNRRRRVQSFLLTSMKDWNSKKELREFSSLEGEVLKTIAAFLNSGGGDLLIGVDDNGFPCAGISCGSRNCKGWTLDKWQQYLANLVRSRFRDGHLIPSYVDMHLHGIEDETVAHLRITARRIPSFLVREKGRPYEYFVRNASRTDSLDLPAFYEHLSAHGLTASN